MTLTALTGASIVLADAVAEGQALLLDGDRIAGLAAADALPAGCARHDLGGGWLLPGFIDVQVNGGGDVLFNDHPSVEGIRAIAAAHRRFGTTGLLPTLISDYAGVVDAAIAAGEAALADRVPACSACISKARISTPRRRASTTRRASPRSMRKSSRGWRSPRWTAHGHAGARTRPGGNRAALTDAGVLVCAGHSLADYDQTRAALAEGLAGFTHLFNAMTQFLSREPGMVGAALEDRASHFGLIVDGLHVHPAALRVALRARGSEGRCW
jgi:N-acetylglucosamine-6-phosphate deacetylase